MELGDRDTETSGKAIGTEMEKTEVEAEIEAEHSGMRQMAAYAWTVAPSKSRGTRLRTMNSALVSLQSSRSRRRTRNTK